MRSWVRGLQPTTRTKDDCVGVALLACSDVAVDVCYYDCVVFEAYRVSNVQLFVQIANDIAA